MILKNNINNNFGQLYASKLKDNLSWYNFKIIQYNELYKIFLKLMFKNMALKTCYILFILVFSNQQFYVENYAPEITAT